MGQSVDAFTVVDVEKNRFVGRMFGWEASAGAVVHIPFDGEVTVAN